MIRCIDASLIRILDLQKAQICKSANTPMVDPQKCENCRIQKVFCDDNKARRLCELSRDDLLTIACRKQEAVDSENQRLKAIIVKYMDGDLICSCCKHFPQCKKEAEEGIDDLPKSKSLFWSCYDSSKFEPGENMY